MEDTQYAFIENVDGIQQLGHLQIATPLPQASYTQSPFGSTDFGPWASDVSHDGL